MSVVHLIPEAPLPVNASAVELLENMLERVRSGEIAAVAVATVGPCGTKGNGWSDHHGVDELWHAAVSLEDDLRKAR